MGVMANVSMESSNPNLRMIVKIQKIADFRKLGPIEEQAITPDLDQLDRLMRY